MRFFNKRLVKKGDLLPYFSFGAIASFIWGTSTTKNWGESTSQTWG